MDLSFAPPLQARSRRTFDAILDAAEALLGSRAFENIGIIDIVQASGVSTGSFYARFASKEALLPVLYTRYEDHIVARGRDLAGDMRESRDLDQACAIFVASIAGIFRDRRNLMRAVVELARRQPDAPLPISARRKALHRELEEAMMRTAGGSPEVALKAVRAGQFMAVSTLREAILYPHAPFAALAAPGQIEATVSRMAAAFIRGEVR